MFEVELEETIGYLGSDAAEESIGRDPYWPKWDSPWWRMRLMFEMGLAARIPKRAVDKMVASVRQHYLDHFPTKNEELPSGVDPHRGVACHCQLGTMMQVLFACGVDVDREIPWIRPWFLRYQLPDGGLNCDEQAYSKITPKSSMVSTLPPLEAILNCTPRAYTRAEEQFLDRGAEYLIAHRLYRSTKTGGVIKEDWLELCFPRFYDYDILRGVSFLTAWAERRKKQIPRKAIEEALGLLRAKTRDRQLEAQRVAAAGRGTLNVDGVGNWVKCDAETFPLLDRVSAPGPNAWLTGEWKWVRETLGKATR